MSHLTLVQPQQLPRQKVVRRSNPVLLRLKIGRHGTSRLKEALMIVGGALGLMAVAYLFIVSVYAIVPPNWW